MAMDPLIHPHTRPSFMEGMLTILLFALSNFFFARSFLFIDYDFANVKQVVAFHFSGDIDSL